MTEATPTSIVERLPWIREADTAMFYAKEPNGDTRWWAKVQTLNPDVSIAEVRAVAILAASAPELKAEIERLQARVKELERERDMWNADSVRLSSGLIAINVADPSVPASVLRSVAYDIALNCITRDVAEFQITERARAVLQS